MDVNKAKHHLAELLDLAKEGNEVLISEGNTAVARLTAISSISATRKPRVAGLHTGAIDVSDDFDAELPDAFWTQTS
jgi:antitoxin (DNA-binding transcriptional repressor) of toxin-antitoxin stability system